MPPSEFWLNITYHSGADMVWRFQDSHCGCHLRYWNGTILAILNLYVAPMPPIKSQLNPTYSFGGDVIWRFSSRYGLKISRWPQWQPSWISEGNNFSNSESQNCSDVSHQVSARSHFQFGKRCRLKNFKMAARKHLGYLNRTILTILNFYVAPMPPIKFRLNLIYGLGDVVWRISRWPP